MQGNDCGEIIADQHGEKMVQDGGDKNAPHDGLPAKTASERHRQQLGFVPHFGQYDKGQGSQECGHQGNLLLLRARGLDTKKRDAPARLLKSSRRSR